MPHHSFLPVDRFLAPSGDMPTRDGCASIRPYEGCVTTGIPRHTSVTSPVIPCAPATSRNAAQNSVTKIVAAPLDIFPGASNAGPGASNAAPAIAPQHQTDLTEATATDFRERLDVARAAMARAGGRGA